ncbi:MAG: peptidylprolyl isomerase [Candidatus Micrarchaeota archaeon]|nr:peptidylprolyl isomerase [Candidatus Micrarchaeota archaeon]
MDKGSFVRIRFTGRRAVTGDVFDTTDAEEARKANIFEERRNYGPKLVVIGRGNVIEGIDSALEGMKPGEARKIEVEPEKAFGKRDPQLVRVMPLSEFTKRDITPYPGMPVELDNRVATVKSVTSGRVLVDFNHPLAGHKLVYDLSVDEAIEGDEAKVKALMKESKIEGEAKLAGGELELLFGEKVKKDVEFMVGKDALVKNVGEYLPNIKKVSCIEKYDMAMKEEEKVEEKKEADETEAAEETK